MVVTNVLEIQCILDEQGPQILAFLDQQAKEMVVPQEIVERVRALNARVLSIGGSEPVARVIPAAGAI